MVSEHITGKAVTIKGNVSIFFTYKATGLLPMDQYFSIKFVLKLKQPSI